MRRALVAGHDGARRRLVRATGTVTLAAASAGLTGLAPAHPGPAARETGASGAPELVAPVTAPGRSLPTLPAGTVAVSPEPGSRSADPSTQLSFLGRSLAQLGQITVTGSTSGLHTGRLEPYDSAPGASFLPSRPFVPGEVVTVRTTLSIVGAKDGTYSFSVARTVAVRSPLTLPASRTDLAGVHHFSSAPGLEAPVVTVRKTGSVPAGSDFLLSPKGTVGLPGPMIVTPAGGLVWFDPVPEGQVAFDLNEQRYEDKPVLTFFQGRVVAGHGEGEGVILDSSYRRIATIHAGNGVEEDLHELQLTPQGSALITAYRAMRWDLSLVGGSTDGLVFDGVVQEIDVRTGLVMEEWDSIDHVPVARSYFAAPKSPSGQYDYFHINAIQELANGILLVSSRNTSAAYEIDPADDGAVVFTLGGKDPSVGMGAGTRFWLEHDVELHTGGLFSVFDDGAAPARVPASRALFLRYEPSQDKVVVARALTHAGALATALGNVQLLPGGDSVVSWGTTPYYSEYSASGSLLYDARLPRGVDSYRAYLDAWSATPATRPSLVVRHLGGRLELATSWNGATGVVRWRVLTGPSAAHLRPLLTTASQGFETTVFAPRVGPLVEVLAVDGRGRAIGRSAVVKSGA